MNTPRTDALIKLVGAYGVQCSETKELAPTKEFADAVADIRQLETECAELLEVLSELMAMRDKCFIPNDNNWWDDKARAVLEKVPK